MLSGKILRSGNADIVVDSFVIGNIENVKLGRIVKLSKGGTVEISDGKTACGVITEIFKDECNTKDIKVSYHEKGVVYVEAEEGATFNTGDLVYAGSKGLASNKGTAVIGTAYVKNSEMVDLGRLNATIESNENVIAVDLFQPYVSK